MNGGKKSNRFLAL
uniref:Uncharacterized protein n=1 Tax=Anguilla anguilla TaxID=7936 RepID=A0A0E9VYW2_ANGAN